MTRGLQLLSVLLALLIVAPVCYAQISGNISLHHTNRDSDRIIAAPGGGEFKLSLGSQMFSSEQQTNFSETFRSSTPARVDIAEGFSDLDTSVYLNIPDVKDRQLKLKTRSRNDLTKFSTTLTLNNAYSEPSEMSDEGLRISSESGRLQVYGEYEQKQVPQIIADFSQIRGQTSSSNLRAAIAEHGNAGESEPTDKNSALASRYYLEAVYSFKPTLKGKVSFKRSMIDTFESEEQLQVEGIVEAGRNILIKAGYNNEVRPEVSEPRSSKDTKVWTEFILKF